MTRVPSRLPLVAAACLGSALECSDTYGDPTLVARRDSAGLQVVEARRSLWEDARGWTVAPEPLVDPALSGSGEKHLFHAVSGSEWTWCWVSGGTNWMWSAPRCCDWTETEKDSGRAMHRGGASRPPVQSGVAGSVAAERIRSSTSERIALPLSRA